MPGEAGTFPHKRMTPLLRGLYERLAFGLALLVFGVGGLLYTVAGPVLYLLLPRHIGAALGQRVVMALFRFFVGLLQLLGLARCDLRALDALRDGPPVVIAPNHPTYLDALLIVSRLPNVACIMKADVLDNVFLGGGAKLARYIRADAPKEMIRAAAAALRAGRHVLFFPEGTRTTQHPVNPFRSGFASIARLAGAPVQTVLIDAESGYARKGWPLLRRPEFPLVYRVRLGERFAPRDESKALVAEVEAYFRRELGNAGSDGA
ncbi:MAG TPA: lysophospholipid acyltransferase family protein [Burkholderiales bacterium]|nr:lysophospholipid acyltransferase family protein [Burkholderiales bacterium]